MSIALVSFNPATEDHRIIPSLLSAQTASASSPRPAEPLPSQPSHTAQTWPSHALPKRNPMSISHRNSLTIHLQQRKTYTSTQPFRRRPRPILLLSRRHNTRNLARHLLEARIALGHIDNTAMALQQTFPRPPHTCQPGAVSKL